MLTQVIQAIKTDIRQIVEIAMESQGLKDSNLYKSLEVISSQNKGDLVFDFMLNDYVIYVDGGRRSGKMPPMDVIVDWCKRHDIQYTNSIIYAIRKTIGEEGIRPRPFLDKIFSEIDKHWDSEWSDELFDKIMKEIDNFFNNGI